MSEKYDTETLNVFFFNDMSTLTMKPGSGTNVVMLLISERVHEVLLVIIYRMRISTGTLTVSETLSSSIGDIDMVIVRKIVRLTA